MQLLVYLDSKSAWTKHQRLSETLVCTENNHSCFYVVKPGAKLGVLVYRLQVLDDQWVEEYQQWCSVGEPG